MRIPLLGKLFNSFIWSCAGLSYAWRADLSFKIDVLLALFLIPLSILVSKSKIELILLIGSVVLVLIAELINTAIETVVDRISFENHQLSKYAKDLGSAIVFCSLILAALVWVICIF